MLILKASIFQMMFICSGYNQMYAFQMRIGQHGSFNAYLEILLFLHLLCHIVFPLTVNVLSVKNVC